MNGNFTRAARVAARLAALVLCAAGAQAVELGLSAQGRSYVSGGVSETELSSLHAQRERFSLWVITAAKGSGAYLADVQVRVTDSQQRVVFDASLDGPWLMIDLPLGRYVIQARFNGETQQRITTIHPGDHHQAFFYFNVDADVLAQPAAPSQAGLPNGKRE